MNAIVYEEYGSPDVFKKSSLPSNNNIVQNK